MTQSDTRGHMREENTTKSPVACSCHGAHSREEQGHADEDVNSNNSL